MLLPHCRTQLVGHSSESTDQIKQCIDDWVTAGSAKGRAFAVAGSNLTVSFITKYYGVVYIYCSDNECSYWYYFSDFQFHYDNSST